MPEARLVRISDIYCRQFFLIRLPPGGESTGMVWIAWSVDDFSPLLYFLFQESATSDRDSGMGQESPPGVDDDLNSEACANPVPANDDRVFAFLVEECILFAFDGKNAKCPKHGDLYLGQIAPDTVFLDLDDRLRIPPEGIKRGGLIGN